MVSALFFVYGCSDISDSPPHSYVSDDNIQTVDFIYDINSLYVSYSVILNNIDETNVKSYLWNFGDNSTSSSKSHTHHYSEKGLYTVILEVILDNDSKLNISKNIDISINQDTDNVDNFSIPIDFEYETKSLTVKFSTEPVDNVKSYIWHFGDGNIYSDYEAVHSYSKSGLYEVILEAVLNNDKKIYHSKKINVSLMDLFFEGFGREPDKMYFALHITGSAANGLFMQQHKTYAKDLSFQLKNGNREKDITFSRDYKKWGLWDLWGIKLYNVQYGWADYDGKKLEMPFYLGDADFKTDINSKNISFASFVIKDKENTIFLGDPSFVRCMTDDLKFTIPNGYNPDIHKNIAKFTINFNGDSNCSYNVLFDGFVNK